MQIVWEHKIITYASLREPSVRPRLQCAQSLGNAPFRLQVGQRFLCGLPLDADGLQLPGEVVSHQRQRSVQVLVLAVAGAVGAPPAVFVPRACRSPATQRRATAQRTPTSEGVHDRLQRLHRQPRTRSHALAAQSVGSVAMPCGCAEIPSSPAAGPLGSSRCAHRRALPSALRLRHAQPDDMHGRARVASQPAASGRYNGFSPHTGATSSIAWGAGTVALVLLNGKLGASRPLSQVRPRRGGFVDGFCAGAIEPRMFADAHWSLCTSSGCDSIRRSPVTSSFDEPTSNSRCLARRLSVNFDAPSD